MRIPGYPYHLEQASYEAWEAKHTALKAEWDRVWAIETAHEKVIAEEAAERKRTADEEAAILAEAKRRLDAEAAKEAAILAEARRRLAEEAKELRIQAALQAMRLSAGISPSTKGIIVD